MYATNAKELTLAATTKMDDAEEAAACGRRLEEDGLEVSSSRLSSSAWRRSQVSAASLVQLMNVPTRNSKRDM